MIHSTAVAIVAVLIGVLSLADAILIRKRILLTLQRIINAGLFFWIASQYINTRPLLPVSGDVSVSRLILIVLCILHGLEIISRWDVLALGKTYQKIRSKMKRE